jgi:hypothetical protein
MANASFMREIEPLARLRSHVIVQAADLQGFG